VNVDFIFLALYKYSKNVLDNKKYVKQISLKKFKSHQALGAKRLQENLSLKVTVLARFCFSEKTLVYLYNYITRLLGFMMIFLYQKNSKQFSFVCISLLTIYVDNKYVIKKQDVRTVTNCIKSLQNLRSNINLRIFNKSCHDLKYMLKTLILILHNYAKGRF
jgi:hypothetical protein